MIRFRTLVLAAATFIAAGFAVNLSAQQVHTTTANSNTFQLITRKLGRGIICVGFGALEIPIKVLDVNFEQGSLAAISYGVLEGTGYFVAREVCGVAEILTFYMPLPGCTFDPNIKGWGYGPIMEPEWIITPETNAYGFFYTSNRTMAY